MVSAKEYVNKLRSARAAAATIDANSKELAAQLSNTSVLARVSKLVKKVGRAKAGKCVAQVMGDIDEMRRLLAQAITERKQAAMVVNAINMSAVHVYRMTDRAIGQQPPEKPQVSGMTRLHKGNRETPGLPDSNCVFLVTPGCILQSHQ